MAENANAFGYGAMELGQSTTQAEPFTTTQAAATTAAPESTVPQSAAVSETEASTAPAETSSASDESSTSESETSDALSVSDLYTPRKTLLEKIIEEIHPAAPSPVEGDPAFFNDAVFIGDSVSLGLKNYAQRCRNAGSDCLGGAQFLCFGSLSYTNALGAVQPGSMHPTYQGQKVSVEDGIRLCGAKKAFIMLGMNDFSAYSESVWQNSVIQLLDRIEAANPDVTIYIESVTPILDGMEHGRFTNENILAFNEYMQSVCSERGYDYIDISGNVMADETGHLKQNFCGDPDGMGIHMTYTATAAWVDYLDALFRGGGEM